MIKSNFRETAEINLECHLKGGKWQHKMVARRVPDYGIYPGEEK